MTRNPARANSRASGSPTYPRPTTPSVADRDSSLRRSWSFMVVSPFAIKISYRIDHFIALRSRKLGKNRKRDHFPGGLLTHGERAFLVAEVFEARLEVKRQRIVHRISDSLLFKVVL